MVSGLIPNFLKAKLAKDVLGPAMTAKMTYHLSTKQVLSTVRSFKADFLAEVAVHLIPDKIVEIVEGGISTAEARFYPWPSQVHLV